MSSKSFVQSLRKMIREEVQLAVRDVIKEILTEQVSQTQTPKRQTYTETYKPAPKKVAPKKYSDNSLLNDILNDTAGFNGEGPNVMLEESLQMDYNDRSEWPTMRMGAMPTMRNNPVSMIPTTDPEGRQINAAALANTEAGAAVVTALTKDYSALMKAIDKKKGK
jgi:hypothetical protein